jgi:acetoin utilization deacetylase AcuC-like enzyme
MVMLYTTDPIYLEHETGSHPERRERLIAIAREIERVDPDAARAPRTFLPATVAEAALAHDRAMLERTAALAAAGGGWLDPDTRVSPRSFEAALAGAGALAGATRAVIAGEATSAFCAVRPPGHHATRGRAMGFCLVNSIAVAARIALAAGLTRVAIVDFDVHHGNGTQDIFWEDPAVLYVSLHRYPFYPGTGAADERGGGPGAGTILNVPLRHDTPAEAYHAHLARALDAVARFKPELLLASAGFDAYREDPIGGLNLDVEDFGRIGARLRELADACCGGRLVSALEGGYHLGRLGALAGAYYLQSRGPKSS